MATVKNVQIAKSSCCDCQKEIIVEDKEIKNGLLLEYKDIGENLKVFKCNDCFQKNPGLVNFRKCEVYSRIVGYLRPIQQWNTGKQQEYKEREKFKPDECARSN